MAASDAHVALRYAVPRWSPEWAVPEIPVPESEVHDRAIEYLRALLLAWAERNQRKVRVLRNIGIRWVQHERRAGFDPDLCLLDPAPDFEEGLNSLCVWEPGIAVPRLAIEIVSPGHPYKDYVDTPERAGACGVNELWVYDPLMAGPKKHGGPYLLQIWRNGARDFERIAASSGPAYSPELKAWLHPTESRVPSKARLQISDSESAESFWPTLEAQRAEEQRRVLSEQSARAEAAERELAELRARLEKQSGDSADEQG